MTLDIVAHVSHCLSCAQTKGNTHTATVLGYPTPDGPFDIVAIDGLQLRLSSQGSTYVLVCVDHFIRVVILRQIYLLASLRQIYLLASHDNSCSSDTPFLSLHHSYCLAE